MKINKEFLLKLKDWILELKEGDDYRLPDFLKEKEEFHYYCEECSEIITPNGEHICKEQPNENWIEEFEKEFHWIESPSYLNLSEEDENKIKSFIRNLLSQTRTEVVLKGGRQRIIEQIRGEVRKEILEEIWEEIGKEYLNVYSSLPTHEQSFNEGFNKGLSKIKSKIKELLTKSGK